MRLEKRERMRKLREEVEGWKELNGERSRRKKKSGGRELGRS